MNTYIGRFAPSPTGPLHLGSLVAAMASYLDARVHGGQWLLRIEDLDADRNVAGVDHDILASLRRCGMRWDGEVTWQSERTALYAAALEQLGTAIYPCACSRKEIQDSQLNAAHNTTPVYPGTCRDGVPAGRQPRAFRLRVPHGVIGFTDRWQGAITQEVSEAVGDFVVRRADGFWAYQLAVVVDDGAQGITHIVRGADLLDSTPRQICLQHLLDLPTPSYLHVPVVTNADGDKLSKQTGAQAFDGGSSQADLLALAMLPAARFLGIDLHAGSIDDFWRAALPAWAALLRARGETTA